MPIERQSTSMSRVDLGLVLQELFWQRNLTRPYMNRKLPYLALLTGLTAAYFFSASIGVWAGFANDHALTVRPATGLALGAVLLLGNRIWPALFVGALLTNGVLFSGASLSRIAVGFGVIGISAGSTLGSLAGAWLVKRFANGLETFEQPRGVFRFILFGSILSTVISPTISWAAVSLAGMKSLASLLDWFGWWLGDMASVTILTPLLVVWSQKRIPRLSSARLVEAALLLVSLIVAGQLFFQGWLLGETGSSLAFLVIPILLWTSLRFGRRGALLGCIVVACFAVSGSMLGMGPFSNFNPERSLLLTQGFLMVVTIMALMLAADANERAAAKELIDRLNQDLERRVRERTAQLELINHELEAFCYSVSHDLRAPLRSIRGFSEVLLERYAGKLDVRGQEFLRRTCESSQTMDTLIEDLLKLSRVTRSELQRGPVNLSILAESIAAELRAAEPARSVEFNITPNMTTEGDEHLLRVVMENLMRNAWKFTGKQPAARIEFGRTEKPTQAFFVRDNGAGFDMAYAGKLFGVFQRLHPASEFSGTGVGLATVQRIVNRHGGRAWATGEVNRGATFYFTLTTDLS